MECTLVDRSVKCSASPCSASLCSCTSFSMRSLLIDGGAGPVRMFWADPDVADAPLNPCECHEASAPSKVGTRPQWVRASLPGPTQVDGVLVSCNVHACRGLNGPCCLCHRANMTVTSTPMMSRSSYSVLSLWGSDMWCGASHASRVRSLCRGRDGAEAEHRQHQRDGGERVDHRSSECLLGTS